MNEENKITLREKLCSGLKYTLAIAISILAICALCFIFVSITTYFAPPLQPMFDQERLGQLGDFLGGTLNPIFGFATVCLLLWSTFMQRKELASNLLEIKQSTKALQDQVIISLGEYNRKQLNDLIQELVIKYEKNINATFDPLSFQFNDIKGDTEKFLLSNIGQMYGRVKLGYTYNDCKMSEYTKSTNQQHEKLRNIVIELIYTTTTIAKLSKDLIATTNLQSIKIAVYSRSKEMIEMGLSIGAIEQEEANTLLSDMSPNCHKDFVT